MIEKFVLGIIAIAAAGYGCVWLFNHVNPWISFLAFIFALYIVFKLTIKTK